MPRKILPSMLAKKYVPHYQRAAHILAMEKEFLRLNRGKFRRLMLSIPIRHGKSEYTNVFIAWLLLHYAGIRILRVMDCAATAEQMALTVLRILDAEGADIDKRTAGHIRLAGGGLLRSVGFSGSVESWTFDWIFGDDVLVDPYEIRSPLRREQCYRDWQTKFASRVNPVGVTRFVLIGSRRHPDDIMGRLLEADRLVERAADRWVYHHAAAISNEGFAEQEAALWPGAKEFDLAGLRKERSRLFEAGMAWEWESKFQNNPLGAPDSLAFDPSWFAPPEKFFYDHPADQLPLIRHRILSFTTGMGEGDPQNNFTAALWLLFTGDGRIFVDDGFIEPSADKAFSRAMALIRGHNHELGCAAFEAAAGGRYLEKLLRDECRAQSLFWASVFKAWSSGKKMPDMAEATGRITIALANKLSRDKIRLRDTPTNRTLFRQLRGFPTEHMDGPKCLSLGDIALRDMLLRNNRK